MKFVLILLSLMIAVSATATPSRDTSSSQVQAGQNTEQEWAVGALFRSATIPFATDERTVATFVPFVVFENDRFFFRAIEGGVKVYRVGDWQLSALGRLRFFDIPKEYQNQIQGDTMDFGLQGRYQPLSSVHFDLEAMTDWGRRPHFNMRGTWIYTRPSYSLAPFAELRWKSKKHNTRYFGLDLEDVGSGFDVSIGAVGDYHLTSNLYLYAAAKMTHLDKNVRAASLIDRSWHAQGFLGFGFTNDRTKARKMRLGNTPYLRLAHGWATPSSLAHIFHGEAAKDPHNNQLTSIFYGYPLTDSLVGLPLDLYLHSGFVWHWKSAVQTHAQEMVVAVKLFYTIKWPVRWRLGAAEGWSYVNKIPYVERTQLAKKGYEPSKLLNFLDFSLDINIGDIAGSDALRPYWLGYSIHHRSAIFESAQQFGRIKGGSNFQTMFLKWHF